MNTVRITALILSVALAGPAMAASDALRVTRQDLGIAAVVNEEAITSYDVDNRVRFVIATTRLSNTPDVIERIRPQVIRSLIDEKLQMQEAARKNITVSDQDIGQAIATIEQQRGMPLGAIEHILQAAGVPKETFTQQIHAQLAWNRLLIRTVRPKIHISDEEVALAGRKINTPAVKQEFQIAALTLPVDKPSREGEVHRLGDKLVGEMRRGASFEEVSRQFSSGAASAGGKVETFWIRPDQADPMLARALASARAGTITDPVRTGAGYVIVKVYETRALDGSAPSDTEVLLKEILLRLKPDAQAKEADVLLQIGEDVAKHPGGCDDKGVANIENLDDFNIEVNFRREMLSELPSALRVIAESLNKGDISSPFASDEGIRLYMLCEKKAAAAKPPSHDSIAAMILQQKMELEAQKYLRNLRRDAFLDVR